MKKSTKPKLLSFLKQRRNKDEQPERAQSAHANQKILKGQSTASLHKTAITLNHPQAQQTSHAREQHSVDDGAPGDKKGTAKHASLLQRVVQAAIPQEV